MALWLQQPDVGYKEKHVHLQHVSQIESILESINPSTDDVTILADIDGDIVWNKCIHPHL